MCHSKANEYSPYTCIDVKETLKVDSSARRKYRFVYQDMLELLSGILALNMRIWYISNRINGVFCWKNAHSLFLASDIQIYNITQLVTIKCVTLPRNLTKIIKMVQENDSNHLQSCRMYTQIILRPLQGLVIFNQF